MFRYANWTLSNKNMHSFAHIFRTEIWTPDKAKSKIVFASYKTYESQMLDSINQITLSTAKKKNQFSIFYGYNVSKSVNKMLNQAMNDIWTSPSVSQPCFWTSVFQVLGLNLVVMDLVYLCIMPVSLIYESTELGQVNLSGKHRQRSRRPFQWQTRRSSLYP